jgi:hypothetical protein
MPQVFLKRRNTEGGSVCVDVKETDTVADVKQKVCDQCGYSLDLVCLVFAGQRMEDDRFFASYHTAMGSCVNLVVMRPVCQAALRDVRVGDSAHVVACNFHPSLTVRHALDVLNDGQRWGRPVEHLRLWIGDELCAHASPLSRYRCELGGRVEFTASSMRVLLFQSLRGDILEHRVDIAARGRVAVESFLRAHDDRVPPDDVIVLCGANAVDLSRPLLGAHTTATTASVFVLVRDLRRAAAAPEPELPAPVRALDSLFTTYMEHEQYYDNVHFDVPPCLQQLEVAWKTPLGRGGEGCVFPARIKGGRQQYALKALWPDGPRARRVSPLITSLATTMTTATAAAVP